MIAFDCKTTSLIVCSSLSVFVGILYMSERWDEQHRNTVVGTGQIVDPSLKFVAVLFRHGNRAPMFKYKTDPHKNDFPEGIMQLTKVGPLLNKIGTNMESSSNNYNTTRKMDLYSGHDISIGMAISFLGYTIEWADVGASLHFHMYYDVTNEYIVKAFYFDRWDNENGEEIPIPIPCKFEEFKKLLTNNWKMGR